jgi:hypothetical protein
VGVQATVGRSQLHGLVMFLLLLASVGRGHHFKVHPVSFLCCAADSLTGSVTMGL